MKKYIWIIILFASTMHCACYESGDIDDIEVLKTLKITEGNTDDPQNEDQQRVPGKDDNVLPS